MYASFLGFRYNGEKLVLRVLCCIFKSPTVPTTQDLGSLSIAECACEVTFHRLMLFTAPSRRSRGQEGWGLETGQVVGGSYQEAVVLGVGGQAQAEAHVVLPFRDVG